jgi:hypothetical protein
MIAKEVLYEVKEKYNIGTAWQLTEHVIIEAMEKYAQQQVNDIYLEMNKIQELKQKKIFVKFIVPDLLPEDGLIRMQYYTNIASDPSKFYFGLSMNTVWTREDLKRMVTVGSLIELPEPILLNFDSDLWLDRDGNVIMALGYDPLNDKNRMIVAKPKSLRRSHVLLMKHLHNNDLPYVYDKHLIVD